LNLSRLLLAIQFFGMHVYWWGWERVPQGTHSFVCTVGKYNKLRHRKHEVWCLQYAVVVAGCSDEVVQWCDGDEVLQWVRVELKRI